ncbi:LutC/YkgG family protein [Caldimonas brevitalea]|uniref:Membrane protein n=1 Tax=Caldimonas brevitalea TaxID=413882 RepID=A0A0G3BMV6_9BURK|nr:LUD domain-containing protein [Caldimonas brevitalea]AKJ28731.1 membrane protein [Caldimonas brevitalea]
MDTSAARERILARIRSRQGRDAAAKPAEQQEAQAWLAAHPRGPLPALGPDLTTHFVTMAERMASTVDRVPTWREAPAAVAAYLAARALPVRAVAHDTLRDLAWAGAGLDVEFRPPRDEDAVSLTACFCAVAETGSLVFASGPHSWVSAHLLPETHVVVLPVSRIVPYAEDAFASMRRELGEMPRGFNMVSGPSRTGDIEQTIVLGAHGPYRVHVVLVDDAA